MKSIKFIFAIFSISLLLTACSATSISEDEELYAAEELQMIGDESSAEIDRDRN